MNQTNGEKCIVARSSRSGVASVGAWLVALLAAVSGKAAATDVWPFGTEGREHFEQQVDTAQAAAYQRIVAVYDAYLQSHPDDGIAAVERCRFIDRFAQVEDLTIESAPADAERCRESLSAGRLAGNSAVKLFLLEGAWDDGAIPRAELLLATATSWPVDQQARLHEWLSQRYARTDSLKSGEHALRAVQLSSASSLRLSAARYLIQIGAPARASTLVRQTPPEQFTAWTLRGAVSTLLDLNAPKAALDLARSRDDLKLDDGTQMRLARALIVSGYAADGSTLLKALQAGSIVSSDANPGLAREMFLLQLSQGSREEAEAAYRKLQGQNRRGDPWGYFRLQLAARYPAVPWQWSDVRGLVALAMVMLAIILSPALIVLPLHYASLIRRARGWSPPVQPNWGFGHLWYGLAAFLLSSSIPLYLLCYGQFEQALGAVTNAMPPIAAAPTSEETLAQAFLLANVLGLIALVPLFGRMRWRQLWTGRWSVPQSVFTGAALGFALLILANVIRGAASTFAAPGLALGSDTIRATQGIYAYYGWGPMLTATAFLTPLIEEVIFRGVFLQAGSRYFGWRIAALMQAAVFVALHDQPGAYLFLTALALTAAWLARQSGGLLAPFALHVINNVFACLSVVGVTRSLAVTP
jgi:membrane protease YdiL (CAAX protease family)